MANQLARLPKFQIRVTPSDTQLLSWGTLTEFSDLRAHRSALPGRTGLNPLGSYYDLAAGIVARWATIGSSGCSARTSPTNSV